RPTPSPPFAYSFARRVAPVVGSKAAVAPIPGCNQKGERLRQLVQPSRSSEDPLRALAFRHYTRNDSTPQCARGLLRRGLSTARLCRLGLRTARDTPRQASRACPLLLQYRTCQCAAAERCFVPEADRS